MLIKSSQLFYFSLNKDKPLFCLFFTFKTQNNDAWLQCFKIIFIKEATN